MKISTDFECGNGVNIALTGPMAARVQIRADRPGYDHYFHFRLDAENDRGTAEITVTPDPGIQYPANLKDDLARGPIGMIWRKRGAGSLWERMLPGAFTMEGATMVIRQAIEPGETWFFSELYPLLYSDFERHVKSLPEHCSHVKAMSLGDTPEGRPLTMARVTDPEVPAAEKGRVFILGGQHGTEFAGMYAVKGALDFVASRLPQAATLRRRYIMDILPCANPDGNTHGLACNNSEARDQIFAFKGAARGATPSTAEAALIWRYLAEEPPDLVLNFHAYAHPRPFGDPPYEAIYVPDPDRLGSAERRYHQHVLNHALFYLTCGGSQHRHPCPARADTLEENAATAWNSLTALYQVQSEEGPHNNLLTGVNVLRAIVDSLELAQAETEGL